MSNGAATPTSPDMSPMLAAIVREISANPEALALLAAALAPALTATGQAAAGTTLSASESAVRARVHPRTVCRACAAGTLRGNKVAGQWQITSHDVADWTARGAPTRPAPPHHIGRTPNRHSASRGAAAIAGTDQRAA